MPALNRVKEQGRRAVCLSNLKQLGLAWTMYADENDDKIVNGKVIPGARKLKSQEEVRRTLFADPVRVLGEKSASKITRKNVTAMVMEVVDRGANVQAGNA